MNIGQKNRFVEGAFKNGISKDIAAGIFLKIEPFAEYGFNKSHAAAYAIIAYQTAYLKTYFQEEFLQRLCQWNYLIKKN